jgi:hypothetical protein
MIASMGAETRVVAAKAVSCCCATRIERCWRPCRTARGACRTCPSGSPSPLSIVERHRAAGDPTALAVEYVELSTCAAGAACT